MIRVNKEVLQALAATCECLLDGRFATVSEMLFCVVAYDAVHSVEVYAAPDCYCPTNAYAYAPENFREAYLFASASEAHAHFLDLIAERLNARY